MQVLRKKLNCILNTYSISIDDEESQNQTKSSNTFFDIVNYYVCSENS